MRRRGLHGRQGITRSLVSRCRAVKLTGSCGLADQLSHKRLKVPLRFIDMGESMKEPAKTSAMVVRAVSGIGKEHGLKGGKRTLVSAANGVQIVEVRRNLTSMPACKDFLYVLEVFVERGAPDARLLSDARHGERMQALSRSYRGCPVHDRIRDSAAMGFDRILPELGHAPTCHDVAGLSRQVVLTSRQYVSINGIGYGVVTMARAATGMPGWVKVFIGMGIIALVGSALLMMGGHGPWQHGGMGSMHP